MTASVKERRTRILLTLFLLKQDAAHDVFDKKIQHIFDLPAESPRSRGTLRQMLQDGIIEKEEKGIYKMTTTGLQELALSFPIVRFGNFEWDGKFRILSYEIPEKKRKLRDSLRREVSGWGLGPWHRSFWLTPHPIIKELRALINGTPWEGYIQAFEGSPVVGNQNVLLEKVWNISVLEGEYKKLFKQWHSVLSEAELSKEDKMKKVVIAYIEIIKKDPGLPEPLVGKHWVGFEAFDIFSEIRRILI